MFGIIEFREEEHNKNLHTLHKIKKDIIELINNMEHSEFNERRGYIGREHEIRNEFDERRGRYGMRNHEYRREGDYNADIVMEGRYRY